MPMIKPNLNKSKKPWYAVCKSWYAVYKYYLLIGFVAIIGCSLGIHACVSTKDRPVPSADPSVPTQQPVDPGTYGNLVSNWNQYAKNYSSHYHIDDKSPDGIINNLTGWLQPFGKKPNQQVEDDLAKYSKEVPTSPFHEYDKFARPRQHGSIPELSSSKMDSTTLATEINKLALVEIHGLTPDHITPETVEYIIYMNDFCAYFAREKDALHGAGIDKNINQCSEAGTDGKYPALDALIDKDSPFYNQ